jgi:MFS family permease
MRAFLAVVAGYFIFAVAAVLLFHLANVDPHSPASLRFKALTLAYGVAFACIGGFVAGQIGRRSDLVCGIALAIVIALGATISMIAHPGAGALWTQIAALFLFAPVSLVGDWARRRRQRAA